MIKEIIKNMSIEEKACQLTQLNAVYVYAKSNADITGQMENIEATKNQLKTLGSILNFKGAEEANGVREKYFSEGGKISPILMQDVIHGYRTIFPIPLAMGGTFDLDIVEDCAKMSAEEAKVSGVDVTFSPMVDLVRDARWGRVMESTGEDVYLNGEMAKAFIRGYHKGGVAACVKHFAGYGASEGGREYNTTDISDRNLKEFYLRGYREALKENPELVMSSFNLLNGVPVNGRKDLLIDLLRNEWAFDGVLISDYAAVVEMIKHGYAENKKECACISINNQIDMEMMSDTYIKYLPELIKEGKVDIKLIDKLVERILILKQKCGLLDSPYGIANEEREREIHLCKKHREIVRIAAEKSLVLLKNDNGILPLKKEQNVSLIGPFASEKYIIGAWSCFGTVEETVSIKEGIEKLLNKSVITQSACSHELLSTDLSGIESAVDKVKDSDVVIACIGELSSYSGESAARTDINITMPQVELLKALNKAGKKVVAVIFGGRPQALTNIVDLVDAIIYAWQPGTEGGTAIANVLYGNYNPSAKLTMSFPRTVGQCPIYYNYFNTGRPKWGDDIVPKVCYNSSYLDCQNSPLYPFGYGLSYTDFEFTDFTLSKAEMKRKDILSLSVKVKNVGKVAGEEVVQMYIRDLFASVVRPVKELKAFKKINLQPNEEKIVTFEITEEMLKFYNINNEFIAENGKFEVMVGNSSQNVQTKTFELID